MDRGGDAKREREHQAHRVPSSASCSSASSTNSPPEKKCVTDNSLPNQQPVVAKPIRAQVQLEFCKAVGRPDSTLIGIDGIPNKILVRKTATASHVLLMGTTSFMLDPLCCPYGEELNCPDECKHFRAASPDFMKSHLERRHRMSNVLINLVCPCPPQWYDKKSCSVVKFDPTDGFLLDHLQRYHEAYFKRVEKALCGPVMEQGDLPKRVKFPTWTNTERLLPSQIIPDKIVFPTVIQDKEVQFVCNIDACSQHVFGNPWSLHYHVYQQHRDRFGTQTQMYHGCPAQDCEVEAYAASDMIISHVAAMHPELLGRHFSPDVKEKCAKYLGQVAGICMGLAVTNTVQTDEKPRSLEVYRCPVENCNKDFLEERDYLVWHILDHHAVRWSLATSGDH